MHSDDRTTPFEIFFDLVLVFALTRVVAFVETDPNGAALVRALVILAMLWWAWCAFIWLGNQVRLDRGFVRIGMLVAMAALFVVGILIPAAWQEDRADVAPALALALAFAVVRACYVTLFAIVAWPRRRQRTQILLDLIPQTLSVALLVVGAVLGTTWQTVLWALAFVVDFLGGRSASMHRGWRVVSARHFSERHDLVLIIAIGESVLAIGSQVHTRTPIPATVCIAILGFFIAASLWWAFFGGLSAAAAGALARAGARRRPVLARDGYTLSHFPIVVGVVLIALGSSLLIDEVTASPETAAGTLASTALAGGVALFFVGIESFRWIALGYRRRATVVGAVAAVVVGTTSALYPAWLLAVVMTAVVVATSSAIGRVAPTTRLARVSGWK